MLFLGMLHVACTHNGRAFKVRACSCACLVDNNTHTNTNTYYNNNYNYYNNNNYYYYCACSCPWLSVVDLHLSVRPRGCIVSRCYYYE